MYAYMGPKSPPAAWDDDPRRDAAVWDEDVEDEDEAYDEFDTVGLSRGHYTTNDAPRRQNSRVAGPQRRRKRRAQSVESTHSASTTGHFITSSQAASPGNTAGFVDLSEEMERRVARALDPASIPSPKPTHLSPKPASRSAPLPSDPGAYSLYQDQTPVPVAEEPKRYWRLPSFQSLLQSVGEFTTLQPWVAQQPRPAPSNYYEDAGATTTAPRPAYSAHASMQWHSFAGYEDSFNSGYLSTKTLSISSENTRRSTDRAYSSDTESTSRTLVGRRSSYERHTSEPPPPVYSKSVDRRQSLPHVFDPSSRNYPPVAPLQVTRGRPLPNVPRPYSAPPASNAPIVDSSIPRVKQDYLRSRFETGMAQPEGAPYSPRSPAYSPTSPAYPPTNSDTQAESWKLQLERAEGQRRRSKWSDFSPKESGYEPPSSAQAEYLTGSSPEYVRASSIGSVGYTTSAESPPGTPVKLYSTLPKKEAGGMKLSEILNDTTGDDQKPEEVPESTLGGRELLLDHAVPYKIDGVPAVTGIGEGTNRSVQNSASFTAPSVPLAPAKAPTALSQQRPSLPSSSSTAQPLSAMDLPSNYSEDTPMQAPKPTLPAVLPPVPLQQNTRIRLRTEADATSHVHNPIKRARRNTADRSAHSDYDDGDDSPPQGTQTDHAQWAQYPPHIAPRKQQPLTSEPTLIIDSPEPHWKQKLQRAVSRSNSIYPEPTQASISSAGSSAWHSTNGGSSFMTPSSISAPSQIIGAPVSAASLDETMATPKLVALPPPAAIRRSSAPKPLPSTSMVPPPAPALFRRRTASATPTPTSASSFASSPLASAGSLPNVGIQSATDLLSQPQVKVALQRHKELSMRAVQEQIGGTWAPRGEFKVMFGDGAPANLLKRYSAREILDSASWGDAGNNQRLWFQVRPEMKGAQEVTTTTSVRKTKSERIDEGWVEVDEVQQKMEEDEVDGEMVSVPNRSMHHANGERLISASKELMIKQLFPKYEPSIQGLPQGYIYLRHDHDRFEYRPHGWGERVDHDIGGSASHTVSSPTKTEAQYLALIRTPGGGTPGPRYIPPTNRRLLQWSLAQARWIFVLNERPTKERPRHDEGYATPDRMNSFLQQGEIVRRLDMTPNSEGEWEWVLPIRAKLWVSPMDEIVKKHGELAAPVWDLGGRMLWDARVGQWRFDVCPPTKEVREVVPELNGVSREVVYDVCEGGRPRISWDHFIAARAYFSVLQRKIVKLKNRARERKNVRSASTEGVSNPLNLNNHSHPSNNMLTVPDSVKIKKEEDIESNYSDSGLEPEPSVLSSSVASISDEHQSVSGTSGDDGLSHHGQQSASLLLNMMLSVGKAQSPSHGPLSGPPSSAGITIQVKNVEEAMQEAVQDNAMSLDLGMHGSGSISKSKLTINPALRKNNGFGEIGSLSPSVSPTASHASTHRSMSVEDDPDSPSNA